MLLNVSPLSPLLFPHEITFTVDIAAGDISNILGRLTSKPYVTQEVNPPISSIPTRIR